MRLLLIILCFIPAAANAQFLSVQADCLALSENTVKGANYQPGVDVNGKALVSADASSAKGPPAIAYPLVVPVEIDNLTRLNVGLENEDGSLPTDVAYVTLFQDGRVEYNGKDISANTEVECVSADVVAPVALEEKKPEGAPSIERIDEEDASNTPQKNDIDVEELIEEQPQTIEDKSTDNE